MTVDLLAAAMHATGYELLLFSGVFAVLFGLDDLLVDAIWLARGGWRPIATSDASGTNGSSRTAHRDAMPMAVFIPAWGEQGVIGDTIAAACAAWRGEAVRIFVGCYCDDAATLMEAVTQGAREPMVRVVLHPGPGPTTKADCLNRIWAEMRADEERQGWRYAGVVLHDAEDRVHGEEIAVLRDALATRDFVQLPVIPLVDRRSRWVASHYCDEFAEAHGKELVVRQAVGAPLPAAGVGCGFARATIDRLARRGDPFDPRSLVEDYEIGMRIGFDGQDSAFVRRRGRDGRPVAVRSHFPAGLGASVRQKTRWITGIALNGWDRIGWPARVGQPRWARWWMLWRDRRVILGSIVVLAAYFAAVLLLAAAGMRLASGLPPVSVDPAVAPLLAFNAAMLCWRLAWRGWFTGRAYGWREGLRAVPRIVVSNTVAILASAGAVGAYCKALRGAPIRWHKTQHQPASAHAHAGAGHG